MLTVFKEKMAEIRKPEWFFDNNTGAFDFDSEVNKLLLKVFERGEIRNGVFYSPLGKGRPHDLKTATKLALCLANYPGFTFEHIGVGDRDMQNILAMPRGTLYLQLDRPFQYLFETRAVTPNGQALLTSTDINVWYFTGGNNEKKLVNRGSMYRPIGVSSATESHNEITFY